MVGKEYLLQDQLGDAILVNKYVMNWFITVSLMNSSSLVNLQHKTVNTVHRSRILNSYFKITSPVLTRK